MSEAAPSPAPKRQAASAACLILASLAPAPVKSSRGDTRALVRADQPGLGVWAMATPRPIDQPRDLQTLARLHFAAELEARHLRQEAAGMVQHYAISCFPRASSDVRDELPVDPCQLPSRQWRHQAQGLVSWFVKTGLMGAWDELWELETFINEMGGVGG